MQNSREHIVQDFDSREIPADPNQATPPMMPTVEVPHDQRRDNATLSEAPIMVSLEKLHPHPQNPRIMSGEKTIEQIRASLVLAGRFDRAHALIVRPYGDDYQTVSGHRRAEAARRAGLTEVPCWVRDYNDQEAFIVLVTSNNQSGLSSLERGMHALRALRAGMEIKAYATSIGEAHQTVFDQLYAAEVADAVPHARNELANVPYKALAKIHVAPRWLWPVLVAAMLAGRPRQVWTVKKTQASVGRLKDLPADLPKWLSVGFLEGLLSGTVLLDDLERIKDLLAITAAELQEIEQQRALASGDDAPEQSFGKTTLDQQMRADGVSFCAHADARNYCAGRTEAAREQLAEIRQAEVNEQNQVDGMTEPNHVETSGEVKELSETPQPERNSDAASASDPMEGADEKAAPTREPVEDAAEPEDGSTLASGQGDDPAIDQPIGPPLLVQQAGELGTILESGAGSNHPKAADADHSTGDPGGVPSSEVKIRRVTIQKKKRQIQHSELFPEEPLPGLEPAGSTVKIVDEYGHAGGVGDNSSGPDPVGGHAAVEEAGAEPPHTAAPGHDAVALERGLNHADILIGGPSAEKPFGAPPFRGCNRRESGGRPQCKQQHSGSFGELL